MKLYQGPNIIRVPLHPFKNFVISHPTKPITDCASQLTTKIVHSAEKVDEERTPN